MQLLQEEIQLKESILNQFADELSDLLANYFWEQNIENQNALSDKTIQVIDLEYEINELQGLINKSLTIQ